MKCLSLTSAITIRGGLRLRRRPVAVITYFTSHVSASALKAAAAGHLPRGHERKKERKAYGAEASSENGDDRHRLSRRRETVEERSPERLSASSRLP